MIASRCVVIAGNEPHARARHVRKAWRCVSIRPGLLLSPRLALANASGVVINRAQARGEPSSSAGMLQESGFKESIREDASRQSSLDSRLAS